MSFHIIFVVFSLFLDIVEAGTVTTISSTSWPVGSDVTFEWSYTNGARQTLGEIQFGVRDDDKRVVQILQVQVSKSEPVTETTLSPPWTWYQGRVTWTGSVSNKKIAFKLTKAALNDSRTFSCYVEWSGVYEVKTIDVTILITASPTVIQPAVDSHYTKGNKVNITCNTTGIPTPSVHWFRGRDSHEYPASTGASYLVFDPIGKEDAGNYKCKATNSVGNNETTVDIVVYYEPSITKPTKSPHSQPVWAARTNTLICTADGNPEPTITWTKNGAPTNDKVESDGNTSTLTLASVWQATGNDKYKCTATNSQGEASATFKLTVGEPGTEPTTPPPRDPNAGARGDGDSGTGVLVGAIVGAVVGVLIIVILIVYFIKCRKGNRGSRSPQAVGLKERGTKSVPDIDDYEPVTGQNELPQYETVDRSKKFQRKPELNYAELDHRGAERSVDQRPVDRRSEPTTYADIVQTWEPTNESMYSNVPRGGQYSNDML